MKVYKFGGASVKNAAAVKNVAHVIQLDDSPKMVVISAMGKTTNALEKLVNHYYNKEEKATENQLNFIKNFHYDILNELFEDKKHPVFNDVHNTFIEIEWELENPPQRNFDYLYDQIVSVGELLSTKIISHYLNHIGINNLWLDARDFIKTDNTYRNASIDWELTKQLINQTISNKKNTLFITQGFIGSSSENFNTTLGREGSDFSAAILAYCLDAESVTIWKDVPGVLNADPKWFDNTQMLKNISYYEAVELAYYGATIIHPKTIKPLQNKHIPLFVKSFVNPEKEGTLINDNTSQDSLIPSFIFKMNQILISISPKDFSFIIEKHLSHIFNLFDKYQVKINLMQNAAISFSVSVDNDEQKIPALINELTNTYHVKYNENVELVTIRHYNQSTIDRVTENKDILLEQKSRVTTRMVMKDLS
ncbi:MAG: aspartate kinase [Vicingaceae bacterium]